MKPNLSFKQESFSVSPLGPSANTPDLLPGTNVQNKTSFFLDEDDEIYEGYGKLYTSYPYRQYTCYQRTLEEKKMTAAILENDYLKAVFLPGLGGRLWSLTDKKTGINLLYTNDVIRPGNLAVRNAWVSGGVEWNIGVIGHSPFTMEQLFTARLEDENGLPILRMYEYERIRKVTYQMDFWLEENSAFLHCRMRIFNQTSQTVPMYWWSNMAVPEYEGGRIFVPANEAYTNGKDSVYKTAIPIVDNIDITRYKNIPNQVDYFFNIPETAPKYIANLGNDGYGLLHMSTGRLKSRKLFSWGNNEGSDNWQAFLTENAGRYVEIQAGLGKTQYGCIPMAPHTAWEWMELYGPIQMSSETVSAPYTAAEADVRAAVQLYFLELNPAIKLADTKALAKKKGELLYSGSEYAAFENVLRKFNKEPVLSDHLEFTALSEGYKKLVDFLETGIFPEYPVTDVPHDFLADDTLHRHLSNTIETLNKDNWYAHYQLGLSYFVKGDKERAQTHLLTSNSIKENPWALHALAALAVTRGDEAQAVSLITTGYAYRKEDLSYLKETWKILLLCHSYDTIILMYGQLPEKFREENRIRLGYMQALSHTGREKEVFEYFDRTDFIPADLRECEDTLGDLWQSVYKKLHGKEGVLPRKYNFHSL